MAHWSRPPMYTYVPNFVWISLFYRHWEAKTLNYTTFSTTTTRICLRPTAVLAVGVWTVWHCVWVRFHQSRVCRWYTTVYQCTSGLVPGSNWTLRLLHWMCSREDGSNCLKLNEDKTRIIWLGTWHQLNKTLPQTLTLQNSTVLQFSTAVKNLGVLIDSQLTMADHIAAACQSGFFQLRQLRSIRQSLTLAAVKTLVPAFISSRLDYCNQLFVSVTGRLLDKL